jgi:hypothetical protein
MYSSLSPEQKTRVTEENIVEGLKSLEGTGPILSHKVWNN